MLVFSVGLAACSASGSSEERGGARAQGLGAEDEWLQKDVPIPPRGLSLLVGSPTKLVWDGEQYRFVFVQQDSIRGTRLSAALDRLDEPALLVQPTVWRPPLGIPDWPPGGSDETPLSPRLACAGSRQCLISWRMPRVPANSGAIVIRGRFWNADGSLGEAFDLPSELGGWSGTWGGGDEIVASADGFLALWLKPGTPGTFSLESWSIDGNGKQTQKQVLPATSEVGLPLFAHWTGSEYLVVLANGVLRLDASGTLLARKANALPFYSLGVTADGHGGLAAWGIALSHKLVAVSPQLEVSQEKALALPADCSLSLLQRAAGGYVARCSPTFYFLDDAGSGLKLDAPTTGRSQAMALTAGGGALLVGHDGGGLFAHAVSPNGQLLPGAEGKLAALVESSQLNFKVSSSPSGYLLSWNEPRYDRPELSHYVRVDASGTALDAEPQSFDVGNGEETVDHLALGSEAMMWLKAGAYVSLHAGEQLDIPRPASPPANQGIVAGSEGFLAYGVDQGEAFIRFFDRQGKPTGPAQVLDKPVFAAYSSGAYYLLVHGLSASLVKPDRSVASVERVLPPASELVFTGAGGRFHVIHAQGQERFVATIATDATMSEFEPLDALERRLLWLSNTEQTLALRADSSLTELIDSELHSIATFTDPSPFEPWLVASAVPETLLTVWDRGAEAPVVTFHARAVAAGAPCRVDAQCGELACYQGTCQAPPPATGGAPSDQGEGGAAGTSADPGSGGAPPESAAGASEPAAGGSDDEGGVGSPDTDGCSCRTPGARNSAGWRWGLLALAWLAASRKRGLRSCAGS